MSSYGGDQNHIQVLRNQLKRWQRASVLSGRLLEQWVNNHPFIKSSSPILGQIVALLKRGDIDAIEAKLRSSGILVD